MGKSFLTICKNLFLCKMVLLALLLLQGSSLDAKVVTGTVVSASDGEPLIGATILVQGTTNGAVTDLDGHFQIQADEGQTLVVSYIGFISQNVRVGSQTALTIRLQEEANSLDDVVVIGYGVQKKKLVTGATVQVKGENIQKLNTTNPLQAMQGQTPGMTIISNSGQPGEGMKVNIRGLGTTGSSGPLYIIDGVRGDISTLNPADIESIDVLKDAASAAIYGNQSANGVVLVTTKSGKEGRSVVSFDAYMGWQSAARKIEMLNAREYMTIMDEQNINSGNAAYDWDNIQAIRDANGNIIDTDWIDQMFKDNAKTESYNLGITGGNQKGNYALTLSYMDQEGIVGGKDVSNYARYNFRVNSEYQVIDNFLKVGEQVSFVYSKKRGISVGNQYNNSLRSAFGVSPFVPVYGDNDPYGTPYWSTMDSDWANGEGNPYGSMMMNNYNLSKDGALTANVFAEMEPLKNLKLRSTLGVRYTTSDYRGMGTRHQYSMYDTSATRTSASQSKSDGFGITWTNTLNYLFKVGNHNFDVLGGMEAYRTEGSSLYGYRGILRDGFDDWSHAWVSNGTAQTPEDGLSTSGGPWDEERMVSYFGRLSWNYKETYMATATVRHDGSSRFASGHRFGTFPSFSAGWVVTNEPFMEKVTRWMDYLKIRASWGQVGNQNIGNYMYASPVAFNHYYNFGTALGSTADQWGAYVSRMDNPDITWETSEQLDLGFDARLLNHRLNVNFDWYYKTTKDWLVVPPAPVTLGVDAPYVNGGDVKNVGVELGLGWNDHIGDDFNYFVNLNGAYNYNEVGNIPNTDGIIHGQTNQLYDNSGEFYRAQNGHPIGYFWGYKTAGLFQNEEEIEQWVAAGNGVLQGSDVKPGDVKYYDVNHDGKIDDNDKVDLGNGMPDFTYGFSVGFDYKGFDFSVTANGSVGNKIVQSYRNVGTTTANYTKAILSRWTGEGTSNDIPRVTNTNVNYQFSDLFIQDGDFLRISNITVGYDFARLLKCRHISQCRLYGQVQNAFTFTKYDGMDPEIGYGMDGWVSGVDLGYYPRPRTILVGVNLKF